MAKGTSLFDTLSGKIGNVVACRIPDAKDARRQGVRAYQPTQTNPQSYAQALQRCKYMPLMQLYRLLRPVILRGQESQPYGILSKRAWFSQALKNYSDGWIPRDTNAPAVPLVPITHGSLSDITSPQSYRHTLCVEFDRSEGVPQDYGEFSFKVIAANPSLQNGDQLTFVILYENARVVYRADVRSIILDVTSGDNIPDDICFLRDTWYFEDMEDLGVAGTVITSRRGANGQYLRSSNTLVNLVDFSSYYLGTTARDAAVRSYMSGSANTDWAEDTT